MLRSDPNGAVVERRPVLTKVIVDFLPAAIAIAISPVPIVAIVLVLGTRRARSSGSAFALGWVAGLAIVSIVVVRLLGGADNPGSGSAMAAYWLKITIGAVFWLMAVWQWRKRPKDGEPPATPYWMTRLDTVTPAKALGIGTALSGANPKNLALTLAAAASIAQAGIGLTDTAIAVAVFVAIGSLTVVGAVVLYLIATDRAAVPLAMVKGFMLKHNTVIMMVVLLLLGAKFLNAGLAGLPGFISR